LGFTLSLWKKSITFLVYHKISFTSLIYKTKQLNITKTNATKLFNLALLARQAWRIVPNLTSLSTRILKAVYYPEGARCHPKFGDQS
jgi:hypothetical protein